MTENTKPETLRPEVCIKIGSLIAYATITSADDFIEWLRSLGLAGATFAEIPGLGIAGTHVQDITPALNFQLLERSREFPAQCTGIFIPDPDQGVKAHMKSLSRGDTLIYEGPINYVSSRARAFYQSSQTVRLPDGLGFTFLEFLLEGVK